MCKKNAHVEENMKMKRVIAAVVFLVLAVGLYVGIPRVLTGNHVLVRFTNSISLDARIYETRRLPEENYDYLAVGSSMTMNNLNSDVLLNYLGPLGEKFYNFSVWGVTVEDIENWTEVLLEKYKPKGIIMFSSMEDFDGEEKDYDYKDISRYIRGYPESMFYLHYGVFGDLHYYDEYAELQGYKNDYDSLDFDANGGVALEVYGIERSMNRWEKQFAEEYQQDGPSYESLYQMAAKLKQKGIDFYFIQVPSRPNYMAAEGAKEVLEQHMERCRDIVESSGQYYYSAVDYEQYSDQYFSDYTHMDVHGATMLTQEFLENVFIPSREQ